MADPTLLPPGIYMTSAGELLAVAPGSSVLMPLTADQLMQVSRMAKRAARDLRAGRQVSGGLDLMADFTMMETAH